MLGFKLRKTAQKFLGSKLLCFWFSVDGFLVCSHITFPFSFSLSVFFLHLSLFVPLLRPAMKSRRSRPFRQLGLGLLLLGCLPPCLGLRPRSLPTSLGYFAFLFLVGFRCVTFSCFSGGQPRRKRRFPTPHFGFVSVRLSLHCLCFSSCASFAFVLVRPCSNPGRSSKSLGILAGRCVLACFFVGVLLVLA